MSNLDRKLFPEYTVDYISNIMGLRKPQKRSLKILDSILDELRLGKNIDLEAAKEEVHGQYPIFTDFEHDFMSLTFALATGVGKTKLMGTFITYLYTNKGIKNFFVVAPNLTIYEKLKNDLGNPSPDNQKYVFKGVGCFATEKPNIWCDDDYRNRPAHSFLDSDSINIFIFNISKFNSDERNMMSINEYLGQSFFDYLKSLDDLVLIMDESHHYRAKSSAKAINDLRPVLGLELTATPQIQSGTKTILFKNVVYEYPLSQAIKDGYTRTPYALTRKNLRAYNLTEDELDMTMINDGINHHENIKAELYKYSVNNNVPYVKPFMLIVCKDTKHAEKVLSYVKSLAFKEGKYADKVILVHSNQTGSEKEENIKLLLDVEKPDNPVEIVIHVNILKEGWDVNNLYTIVPLRTAASRTLREQTIGRGLRLPYGHRTGDKYVDSVTITAHDEFDEIIAEAQRGDSIFKADGIIYAEYEKEKKMAQVYTNTSLFDIDQIREATHKEFGADGNDDELSQAHDVILESLVGATLEAKKKDFNKTITKQDIKEAVEKDLGERYKNNTDLNRMFALLWGLDQTDEVIKQAQEKTMYIPKIKVEHLGNEQYIIQDFDLDLSELSYVPISNEILLKNLLNYAEDAEVIRNGVIDFDSIKPEITLASMIRNVNEIDYEKCSEIIQKCVIQFLTYYRNKYSEEEVRNICLMYKKDIARKIANQIIEHLAIKYDDILETVEGIETVVNKYVIDVTGGIKSIFDSTQVGENISSLAFDGAKKSINIPVKFDSEPERKFAVVCENSPEVIRWLRPSSKQFNITYNHGKRYEPDFVVETADCYYLVEVKASNKLHDADVLAKKDRAIKYCKVASEYNIANGHKPFKYLFIPHDEIALSSSFDNLRMRFEEE